jgi:DNA invertase Pin-like site-specific DNA recombinase
VYIAVIGSATRRAVGIVRVSQTNGREGDSFASPGEQTDRIRTACERDGLRLVELIEELDVSGGTALADREGLRQAVEAVEAGEADVIVAAYFDRLVRSLRVQDDLISRVEAAGGQVLALDTGQVTNGSAGQWLSGTMLGAVAEYARRTAAERSAEAQARAVARGVLPWPNVPPGYVRGEDGVLVPDPSARATVREAFEMRADGATVAEVRTFFASRGIERSYHGVTSLLASRVMLGEIHFGDLVNLTAHEPIVDRDLWQRVQRVSTPRGRKPKSGRLLARLGVLRCASCGARMVVGSSNHGSYALYRCPPTGDCTQRVTISAEKVETLVVEKVRKALSDAEGRANIETNAREAERAHAQAQEALDAAVRSFAAAGVMDEPAAVERLTGLRTERDAARERVEQLGGQRASVTVNAASDWDRLSPEARRGLIRATIDRVEVTPGRGAGRVSVHLVGE